MPAESEEELEIHIQTEGASLVAGLRKLPAHHAGTRPGRDKKAAFGQGDTDRTPDIEDRKVINPAVTRDVRCINEDARLIRESPHQA